MYVAARGESKNADPDPKKDGGPWSFYSNLTSGNINGGRSQKQSNNKQMVMLAEERRQKIIDPRYGFRTTKGLQGHPKLYQKVKYLGQI